MTETEDQLVESFASGLAKENEKPFFQSRYYAKRVYGKTYRVNFYNAEKDTIRSIAVKIIDGTVQIYN